MRPYIPAALGLAGTVVTALSLRRIFTAVTVDGDSMMPAFSPGDRVLVRRARADKLRAGQVVVVERPGADGSWAMPLGRSAGRRDWMIKRLAAVPGDPAPADCLPASAGPHGRLVPPGKLVVLGDNPSWSHDSRQLGYLPSERLLGVVVRRMQATTPAGNGDPRASFWHDRLTRTDPTGTGEMAVTRPAGSAPPERAPRP